MIEKIKSILNLGVFSFKHIKGTYSQFGEDVFLRFEFRKKKKGFYIDIGAYDPHRYSNTHYLRSKGWNGINIEPQPDNYEKFKKYCQRDINLNCAISQQEGKLRFSVDDAKSKLLKENEYADCEIEVNSFPLVTMLDKYCPHGQHIDFMSIDCEGYDIEVLATNNWDKYRPTYVLVEDHEESVQTPIDDFMRAVGYSLVSWYRLTKIYRIN